MSWWWRDFCDWLFGTGLGIITLLALIAMPMVAFAVLVIVPAKERDMATARAIEQAFFDECRRHRPQYECLALWRAGDPGNSTIIPIVIPAAR